MQVNLNQDEIIRSVKEYVASQGISVVGKKIEITFSAGRKGNGLSAVVLVEDVLVTAENPLPAEKLTVNGETTAKASTDTPKGEKADLAAKTLNTSTAPTKLPAAASSVEADSKDTSGDKKEAELSDRPLGELPKEDKPADGKSLFN